MPVSLLDIPGMTVATQHMLAARLASLSVCALSDMASTATSSTHSNVVVKIANKQLAGAGTSTTRCQRIHLRQGCTLLLCSLPRQILLCLHVNDYHSAALKMYSTLRSNAWHRQRGGHRHVPQGLCAYL